MKKALFTYLLISCFATGIVLAQELSLSNEVEKTVALTADSIILDSLSIAYHTIQIFDPQTNLLIDTSAYQISNNTLYFQDRALQYDSLVIKYRRLPYAFNQPLIRIDTSETRQIEDGVIGVTYNPYERDDVLLDFKGLDYNGNFTRGVSFGNNQDLVLNSSFNLQLAGELGDGVEILAAITDENIPLQPEGNTQQLQEFDRIFVQLKKGNASLTAGDYELQRPDSYFMNYFKKLQGATFSQDAMNIGQGTLSSQASIAISRGQFTRNQITAIEGNQGPFRLRGAEGERFIIVLAGTEKVFLDGRQMERGLEADYIIDYNRGELTFTNKQLITKDSRIVVEFEYADQSYVRSLYATGVTYENKKLKLDFNLFSQQDSRNATGDLQLSDEEKRILSKAGDNPIRAVASGIDSLDEFSPFRVAYTLSDTLLSCFPDSIIQYLSFSTIEMDALYSARFSFVGLGNGQYILDETQAANERVYRWVGVDDNCIPLGDHEPVVQLVAPKQQRLITMGGQYQIGKQGQVHAEVAWSQNNLNRFSRLDKDDDDGIATYIDFNRTTQFGKDSTPWQLETRLSYEYLQETFTPLNPYRNPEFLRDWNLANIQGVGTVDPAREQIAIGEASISRKNLGSLSYRFSTFIRDSLYTGYLHFARLRSQHPQWDIDLETSLLETEEPTTTGRFIRPKGIISRKVNKLGGLRIGIYGELERNEKETIGTDTLRETSFYFNRYRLFIETGDRKDYSFGVSASQRLDFAPVASSFQESTNAREANINGSWSLKSVKNRMRLSGNLTYRNLVVHLPERVNQEAGETFLGRGDLNFSLIKGTIQSTSTYELGSGQEPKVEFTYVQVNPGEGNYVWLDTLYNNDGIIQPNEMEIAPFQDLANYIRVSTITDDFIRTDNTSLNQSLRISPKAIWYSKKGVKKLLSRFSTISNLSIRRKTQKADDITPYNPFQLNVSDTALVAVTSNVRNVLFFNQADPVYDVQIGMLDNRNKFVQTTGFESRGNTEQFLKVRWNISRKLSTNFSLMQGSRSSDSEFFNNKDFQIEFVNISPELSYLPSKQFRTRLKFLYQEEENTLMGGGEASWRNELEAELRYNRSSKRAIQARFSMIDIRFQGTPNSPVGFAMLNGLQRGRNFLWNISLDQQLAKNIQLRISYEGRKTGSARMVHTGRAQVAANF
jgi:hypothetical protein